MNQGCGAGARSGWAQFVWSHSRRCWSILLGVGIGAGIVFLRWSQNRSRPKFARLRIPGAGDGTFCPEPEPLEHFARSRSRDSFPEPKPSQICMSPHLWCELCPVLSGRVPTFTSMSSNKQTDMLPNPTRQRVGFPGVGVGESSSPSETELVSFCSGVRGARRVPSPAGLFHGSGRRRGTGTGGHQSDPADGSVPGLPTPVGSAAVFGATETQVTTLSNGLRVASEPKFGQHCTVGGE